MNTSLVIQGILPLRRHAPMQAHDAKSRRDSTAPARVSRIARLMAIARHIEELVRSGSVESYAAAARLGRISRARMSQIIGLLNLAPDLQEQLLFLEAPSRGRSAPVLRQVLIVAAALDWDEQRRRWRKLQRGTKQRRAAVPST
jgi:hypothetical protein